MLVLQGVLWVCLERGGCVVCLDPVLELASKCEQLILATVLHGYSYTAHNLFAL